MQGGAVGKVVESRSPDLAVGDTVFHMLGWREQATAPAEAFNKVPPIPVADHHWLGNLGLTGATAYFGLLRVAQAKEGDIVFVSAAAGAVGSAVVQIAKAKGMTVIGSAGGADKVAWVRELGADAAIDYKAGPLLPQLLSAAPKGIDVYFDNVGGEHLDAAFALARQNARFAICGMIDDYNKGSTHDFRYIMRVIAARIMMKGFIYTDYLAEMADFYRDMGGWIALGQGDRRARRSATGSRRCPRPSSTCSAAAIRARCWSGCEASRRAAAAPGCAGRGGGAGAGGGGRGLRRGRHRGMPHGSSLSEPGVRLAGRLAAAMGKPRHRPGPAAQPGDRLLADGAGRAPRRRGRFGPQRGGRPGRRAKGDRRAGARSGRGARRRAPARGAGAARRGRSRLARAMGGFVRRGDRARGRALPRFPAYPLSARRQPGRGAQRPAGRSALLPPGGADPDQPRSATRGRSRRWPTVCCARPRRSWPGSIASARTNSPPCSPGCATCASRASTRTGCSP